MKRWLCALLALALTAGMAFAETSVSTPLDAGSEAARENAVLAASKLDGCVVATGDTFSFNETVGPRAAAYGFVPAENGRGAVVTGGGAAQAAATLYLALNACEADVAYTSLRSYGATFTGGYVENGGDAVLVDYAAGQDFSFENCGGDLMIEMWEDGGRLYCGVTVREEEPAALWTFAPTEDAQPSEGGVTVAAATAAIPLNGSEELRNNVALAAESIRDTVLTPGDLFSFNEIVGPREKKYGYQRALNGRGANVVGGGVAQVASVLWMAARQLDSVAIVEKSTYGSRYNQHYVESSNDAILTDYDHTDFSFRYTGDSSLTISTYIANGWLICEMYIDEY